MPRVEGMTPVMRYWTSTELLWLDGREPDRDRPCEEVAVPEPPMGPRRRRWCHRDGPVMARHAAAVGLRGARCGRAAP